MWWNRSLSKVRRRSKLLLRLPMASFGAAAHYIQSVNQFGVSCYANACANPRLHNCILRQSQQRSAVPAAELAGMQQTLRAATRTTPAPATAAAAPAPRARFDIGQTLQSLWSHVPLSLPLGHGLDWSWLLMMVPALLSPVYAIWRTRGRRWSQPFEL